MKLLTNRTGSYLTGDELADAVMRYGVALARRHELDVVDIPFITSDGTVRRVQLTIGWSADTTATTSSERRDELTESDTARLMNEKADHTEMLRAHPFSPDELDRLSGQHHLTAEWI